MTKTRRVEKSMEKRCKPADGASVPMCPQGNLAALTNAEVPVRINIHWDLKAKNCFWGSLFLMVKVPISSCQHHHQREHYPHHRDQPHLHGRIMMHFSLSWQTTHSLSSLSRSTSLSSWNDILILILTCSDSDPNFHSAHLILDTIIAAPPPASSLHHQLIIPPLQLLPLPLFLPLLLHLSHLKGNLPDPFFENSFPHQILSVFVLVITVPSMSKHWNLKIGSSNCEILCCFPPYFHF